MKQISFTKYKLKNKMWNTEDKNGFEFETLNNRGQINIELEDLSSRNEYSIFKKIKKN